MFIRMLISDAMVSWCTRAEKCETTGLNHVTLNVLMHFIHYTLCYSGHRFSIHLNGSICEMWDPLAGSTTHNKHLYVYIYILCMYKPFQSLTYLRFETLKLNNSLHNHINKNKHMFVGALNIRARVQSRFRAWNEWAYVEWKGEMYRVMWQYPCWWCKKVNDSVWRIGLKARSTLLSLNVKYISMSIQANYSLSFSFSLSLLLSHFFSLFFSSLLLPSPLHSITHLCVAWL